MALERAIAILEMAAPIAEAIPILGTPVKGAFEATGKILKYAGEVKSNKEKTKDLAEHAATLFKALKDRLDEMKDELTNPELERLGKQVKTILDVLTDIMNWTAQRAQRSRFRRTWQKADDSDDLNKMRQRLQDVYHGFMMESQIGMDRKLARLISDTDQEKLLKSLAPVFSARYDARAAPKGCLLGTRIEVLKIMLAWCVQPKTNLSIFWLAGHAGTGKSSIAKTLSESLSASKTPQAVVVTFFASNNSQERRDPLRILHNIVYELARADRAICSKVLVTLGSNPEITQLALKVQIEQLLLTTLKKFTTEHSLIILIDALDECLFTDGVEGGSLVHDLATVLADIPVKLVVTSRMEQSLDRMFRRLPCSNNVELYKIEGDHVTSDVRLIFEQGFEDIKKNHDISTRPWPLKAHLDLLVERTGRFIIFAATVLKFVDSDLDRFPPEQLLDHILQNTSVTSAGDEYEAVDKLYLNVLERAARRSYDAMNIDPSLCARLRALIGTVILLQNPLSIPALAQLMGTPEGDVSRDVRALSAVLLVGPDTDSCEAPPVRIFHPSFRDFLLERCKDPQFLIDSVQQQQILSVQCLQTLNKTLKYDICDIKDPTVPHSEVVNPMLSVRLKQHVPEAVQHQQKPTFPIANHSTVGYI